MAAMFSSPGNAVCLDSYGPGAETAHRPSLVQHTPSTGEKSEVKKGSGIRLMSSRQHF